MTKYHFISIWACLSLASTFLLASGSSAHAAADEPRSYALVIGSNPGGPGQELLRYAEDDAERVARVLTELGGVDGQRVRLLKRPTPRTLLAALDEVGAALRADAERGAATRFFFYYSGHARAHALNLGRSELRLELLRDKLVSLPAGLTIVVLDACQSGAFSRIKGVQGAADFSFNSVARLNAEGMAVMASSSATELSQESRALRSSYFTHHLLVALRGAGDKNRDGRVSLDEAYEYAYQQTLTSTAATAVGSQHVTLETDLRGKGDIALSFPARADAHLQLPAELVADVLVQTQPGGAVVAEVHKSAGKDVRIALPHGVYRALVRARGAVRQCRLRLVENRSVSLVWDGCVPVRVAAGTSKGATDAAVRVTEVGPPQLLPADPVGPRFAIEFTGGIRQVVDDAYTNRLSDFGFDSSRQIFGRLILAGTYRWRPNVDVVIELDQLEAGRYGRPNEGGSHDFSWTTWSGLLALRYVTGRHGSRLRAFAQAGVGLAGARTIYEAPADNSVENSVETESFVGYRVGAGIGLQVHLTNRFALITRLGYDHAPVVRNLIGDVHDSGGFDLGFGGRVQF